MCYSSHITKKQENKEVIKMDNEQLKTKKREILKEIESLQNSVGNPSVIYPSVEAQKTAIKRLNDLIAEYQLMPRTEFLVATMPVGIAISLSDGNARYSLRYNGNGRFDFYEGSIYKSSDIEWSEDYSTAKVKVGTMNSDTQGETVDYIYILKIVPIHDPMIRKLFNVTQPVTAQKPKQPEAKKKYPRDYGMEEFGFVRDTTTGGWINKAVVESYERAERKSIEPKKDSKKRKGLFSHDKKNSRRS